MAILWKSFKTIMCFSLNSVNASDEVESCGRKSLGSARCRAKIIFLLMLLMSLETKMKKVEENRPFSRKQLRNNRHWLVVKLVTYLESLMIRSLRSC